MSKELVVYVEGHPVQYTSKEGLDYSVDDGMLLIWERTTISGYTTQYTWKEIARFARWNGVEVR